MQLIKEWSEHQVEGHRRPRFISRQTFGIIQRRGIERSFHRSYQGPFRNQIEMDVARAFSQYQDLTSEEVKVLKDRLCLILMEFFRRHPKYHYYQGFHDFVGVLVANAKTDEKEEEGIFEALEFFSSNHLRELLSANDLAMIPTLIATVLAILSQADLPVYRRLRQLTVPPFFCISWLMTWFSHDVPSLESATILFNFFAHHHPMAIIYACAAVPILVRDEFLEMKGEEMEIHQWLKELPNKILPQSLILQTIHMMNKYPMQSISFSEKIYLQTMVYGRALIWPSRTIFSIWWMVGIILTLLMAIILAPGTSRFKIQCLNQ